MAKRVKKMWTGYKDTFSIEKVSVGFDRLFETIDKIAEEEVSSTWYPPYNIRKTSAFEYSIDVELTGYDKKEISAKLEGNALVLTAPGKEIFSDPEGDDVYYHQGIFPGGELYAKFYIADGLKLESATYDDGIVTFKFRYSVEDKPTLSVPIGPFESEQLSKPYIPISDSLGRPIGGELPEENKVILYLPEPREEVPVVVNEETSKKPTVEVITLDPMPQVVEVSVENVAEVVNKKSDEPQATIVLNDASFEVVSDDVVTEVIKTEAGQADIVVAIPQEVADQMKDAGINVVDSIEKALEKSEVEVPPLPPVEVSAPAEPSTSVVEVVPTNAEEPVEVVVPEVLPSVVEVKVEDGQVVLNTDVAENIPASADLVPVVTMDGQPDIVVAVTPSTQEHLENLGVDVATDISTAVIEAQAEVTPTPVEVGPVFETTETPVVVNGENPETPTVEVVLPDPLPQIVEVGLVGVAEAVDPASEVPQATITVSEAVHEVSDNVVTEVIKTEEGKSDIVVAIPEEVQTELAEKGIDVVQAVTEAIAQAELPPPELPAVQPTEEVKTEIVTEAGTEVQVVAPEIIPQVVEATVEMTTVTADSLGRPLEQTPTVVLSDVSGDIPADATLVPVVTGQGEHDVMVAVTPETQVALEAAGVDVAADVGAALVQAQTEVVVAEPAPATASEPAPEATVTTTVLNADNPEIPTLEVVVPDPLPQIVEAVVETKVETVDPASSEPQITVTLQDATHEVVSDNVVTEVIKTPEGSSDTIVALDQEAASQAADVGVDVMASVQEAVAEVAPAPADLPPAEPLVDAGTITIAVPSEEAVGEAKIEVVTPEVIPQVVEAVVTDPTAGAPVAVELVPASENVPADATVIPVVTMEGQPDVMVAVTPETQAALDAAGVDVAKDVGEALIQAEVEVAKVEETKAE